MKKQVYIINEECHGAIGVASSPKSAMRWLIDEGWIVEYSAYGIWDEAEHEWYHTTVARYCEQNNITNWQQWLMNNASIEFLEDGFLIYLRQFDLATTE